MTTQEPTEHRHRRLSPLTPLVRSFIFLVAFASASWRDAANGDIGVFGWLLLAIVLAGAIYGTASWLRTKYWIEGAELRVDTGVISRQSRRIRVDRLQSIDIVQPLAARILGLAELKMDVAGGGRSEGSLAYLPLREAHALKEQLLARRDQTRSQPRSELMDGVRVGAGETVAGPEAVRPRLREQVLVRLDMKMLVVSLLLAGETFGFLVSAAVFLSLFALLGAFAGVGVVVPIVGGFALVQGRRFAAFYRFTVAQTPAGLLVRRGLFELSSQTIALHRVQGVVITEPLLWRPLGWARLDVAVAGYSGSSGDPDRPAESTALPVGDREVVLALARHLLRGLDPSDVRSTAPPTRSRWAAPVRRAYMAAGVGAQVVSSRSGVLTRRTHVVPHARVQSVQVRQGPWQRRLRLADLLIDSPPGPVRVRARHRDEGEARALLDLERELARSARYRLGEPKPDVP